MLAKRREYPSDLSEQQWDLIKELIPKPREGGRKRTTEVREVVNAILYLLRTGMAWRYLPEGFPPWKTVYDYFSRWSGSRVWQQINLSLLESVREKSGREKTPSLGIVDAQSVRCQYGERRGFDAIKKVRGRKRNIIVDTLGFIWSCEVGPGNEIDSKGGLKALEKMPKEGLKRLTKILGDSVYTWPMDYYAEKVYGIELERIDKKKYGTNMKPKRWIVERTFAWLNRFRRLARDYEKLACHSETMIYLAMITLLLQRLQP